MHSHVLFFYYLFLFPSQRLTSMSFFVNFTWFRSFLASINYRYKVGFVFSNPLFFLASFSLQVSLYSMTDDGQVGYQHHSSTRSTRWVIIIDFFLFPPFHLTCIEVGLIYWDPLERIFWNELNESIGKRKIRGTWKKVAVGMPSLLCFEWFWLQKLEASF
jgi:hypothetical protein